MNLGLAFIAGAIAGQLALIIGAYVVIWVTDKLRNEKAESFEEEDRWAP